MPREMFLILGDIFRLVSTFFFAYGEKDQKTESFSNGISVKKLKEGVY